MIASLFSAIPALLALAQPDPEQPTPQLSERELIPDTTSPVTLPNLRVRVYQDPERGEVVSVQGWNKRSPEEWATPEAYNIEVDKEKGTYKVTPVDPAEVLPPEWRLKPQSYHPSRFAWPSLVRASFVQPHFVALVSYTDGLTVFTRDVAGLLLTATQNVLHWTGDTTAGKVVSAAPDGNIFAANPSPAGTRWFVNTVDDSGIVWFNVFGWGMVPRHSIHATYENWNFGNEFQATYVKHITRIWGDPIGNGWTWWDWEKWGEAGYLLQTGVLYH